MKKLLLALLLLPNFLLAGNVTDTIHAKRYSIHIDTLNYATQSIKGRVFVTIQSKLNGVSNISLQLLKLNVDSVLTNGHSLQYSYNDTLLRIKPTSALIAGDTIVLQINYHGKPQADARFGGFIFNGSYAFNIGVGFLANPHNLGRCWFPCIDAFDDKAFYNFYITVPPAYKAYSNGTLQDITTNPDGNNVFHWALSHPIPPYLAAMAVAPFVEVHRNYKGIPMVWAVMAADSNKTKAYFGKIDTAMRLFINSYGPYPWEKVGYVCVPFNAGAMEHATSIHIGTPFIDGTLNYETIGPHELSHMWWGDKVTCANEQEMWLNEGFASYNERLFTQAAYGETAYKNAIRSNHRAVLQLTHTAAKDSNYFALDAVPHKYTYGSTVYDKGADVVHTLRYYMGDARFFQGCKDYLTAHAFGNAASAQLRDALTTSSGIDMTDFFDGWVFTPGFPHFSIDSVRSIPAGSGKYNVNVYTRQRSKGNVHLYKMVVPCELTDGVHDTTIALSINSLTNSFNLLLSFNPAWTALDRGEEVSDAISDYEQVISITGAKTFPETNVSMNVINAGVGNSTIRIEHNWVAPDAVKNTAAHLRVSDYHYWKIDGLPAQGFVASALFSYNGSTNSTAGYIDNTFIKKTEDSLVIAYRYSPAGDWKIWPYQKLNKGGSTTDKVGSIKIDSLQMGEYALAENGNYFTGIGNVGKDRMILATLYPNPLLKREGNSCTIDFKQQRDFSPDKLQIFAEEGRLVYELVINAKQKSISFDVHAMPAGTYLIALVDKGIPVYTEKLIIQ